MRCRFALTRAKSLVLSLLLGHTVYQAELTSRRLLRRFLRGHSSTADGAECRCLLGCWCWQVRPHHTGHARRPPLATSATANTVQDGTYCLWFYSWHRSRILQGRLYSVVWRLRSLQSSFGWAWWYVRSANKNSARPTEFSNCSATHLEQPAWGSALYDHQSWAIQSSAENASLRVFLKRV